MQHLAFRVRDRAELQEYKQHLEANGVEVLGVTDDGAFHSIYFFDPNRHLHEVHRWTADFVRSSPQGERFEELGFGTRI